MNCGSNNGVDIDGVGRLHGRGDGSVNGHNHSINGLDHGVYRLDSWIGGNDGVSRHNGSVSGDDDSVNGLNHWISRNNNWIGDKIIPKVVITNNS